MNCRQGNNHTNIVEFVNKFGTLIDVSCGAHHTLMVNMEGEVYGWGKN